MILNHRRGSSRRITCTAGSPQSTSGRPSRPAAGFSLTTSPGAYLNTLIGLEACEHYDIDDRACFHPAQEQHILPKIPLITSRSSISLLEEDLKRIRHKMLDLYSILIILL
jgi:hypothetical protein